MKNYFILIFFILFYSGCNQSATSVFKKDPLYGQYLQYTKIEKIIKHKDEVDSLFNITYLNSANKKLYNDKNNQCFLIGLYDNHESNITNYSITLDDKNPIKISKIDINSEDSKLVPLKNRWANYYIINFNQVLEDLLVLKIKQISTNKELKVNFIKE